MLLAFLSMSCYAQSTFQVDSRLLKNHGESIIALKKSNSDYYAFLLYEINNAYFISAVKPSLKVKYEMLNVALIKDENGNTFDNSALADLSKFNFKMYNFKQSYNNRVVYLLDDGRYLIFYALKEIKENYKMK